MPGRRSWIALVAWLACAVAFARDAGPAAPPSATGDVWVDATLVDIDRYAARYPDAFVDELARYHNAPRALVEGLLADARWSAGDIYFACSLAQYAGQPCRNVVALHDGTGGEDWQAIAARLGVAPGSQAFHRIKRAIVHSYDRWARPLAIDASLQGDFPKHDVAPAAPKPAKTDPAAKPDDASKHAGRGDARR